MKFTLRLIDWQASAPGLASAEEWQRWAAAPEVPDSELPLAKCSHLPMMTARRLSSGSRAAVDCGLAVLKRQPVDALVFTSRHGIRCAELAWQEGLIMSWHGAVEIDQQHVLMTRLHHRQHLK